MQDVVRGTLSAICARGHVLLEGVPGLGKTLLVKSISRALGLSFKRVQFTPDLMPSDVTGTQVLTEDQGGARRFVFKQGPVFANIVLADEINRATPKTQASLLEAMEERQVTVLDETYLLPNPFFVLATQNPIESEGTYPLPEAQLDRFLMKVLVPPPSSAELKVILSRTTGTTTSETASVFPPDEAADYIAHMQGIVRHVVISDPMQEVIVRIIAALTPTSQFATPKVKQYVRFGPGPRGAQAVVLAAKVGALLDGRINLSFEDIRTVIHGTLRHRLILNFQAEADGVTADDIIEEIRNAK
jgi:MoxR-like ATPase